jgi:hypothetical protein
MKFKVVEAGGFYYNGKMLPKGEVFNARKLDASISAGLHFIQIEQVKSEKEPTKP